MERGNELAWLKRIQLYSQLISDYLFIQSPDDSFGWGRILKSTWFPTGSEQPSGAGLLLVGPAGCGKHTVVHHMLHLLPQTPRVEIDGRDEAPYAAVFLDEDSLADPEEDFSVCQARLNLLLDHYYDRGQGLFLVLEHCSRLPFSRKLFRFLEEQLVSYFLSRGENSLAPGPKDRPGLFMESAESPYPPLFLVLLEEEEPKLPALLRSRLQLCRMSLPDLYRRREFLLNHDLQNVHVDLDEIYPGQSLADLTEGLSYAQLEDLLADLCGLTADLQHPVSLEEEDSLRLSQLPTSLKLPREAHSSSEETLDKLLAFLAQSAIMPRGTLPEQASNLAGEEPATSRLDAPDPADFDPDAYRQRLEKMSMRELEKEYFQTELNLEPTPN